MLYIREQQEWVICQRTLALFSYNIYKIKHFSKFMEIDFADNITIIHYNLN